MTKDDILKELEEFQKEHPNPPLSGYNHPSWSDEPNLRDFKGFTSEAWIIGGRSGGTEWNNGANASLDAEEPQYVHLLDEFLIKFMPNISFLQYKNLTHFFNSTTWVENEYHGNFVEYKCCYISFDDIAEVLYRITSSPPPAASPPTP